MSDLSRRALVANAAALPALAVPGVASAADDTLLRIEQHRACQAEVDLILKRQNVLDKELPDDRRVAYLISDRGTDAGANDDPRWTATQNDYWAAEDRLSEIAWSFVDRPPNSIAGVVALLDYANEYEESGNEWPNRHHFFSEDGRYLGYEEECWRTSMNEVLARTLREHIGRA